MKAVFIVSTMLFVNGKKAGSQRVLNIAKSLANENVKVYLASFYDIDRNPVVVNEIYPGIYRLQSVNIKKKSNFHLLGFLRSVNRFVRMLGYKPVIYLYPTTFIFKDFIYLLNFKFIKRCRFYCEINELRVTNAFVSTPPRKILPRVYFYMYSVYNLVAYKISELLAFFSNGIVVISTNLERYFQRYTSKIVRIPILCDVTKENLPINEFKHYHGAFKICFAGTINIKKEGFNLLFQALALVKQKHDIELYLYGILEVEDRFLLDQFTNTYGLQQKVFYEGNIEPEELSRKFSEYHLLILPRPLTPQTKYGFSTKLSEYLTSGIPVLVTDVSDNSLYIKDNYNGFIISPGSLPEMVNKVQDIIDHYNARYLYISRNAIQTAQTSFDYRLYSKTLTDFFFPGR